MGAISGVLGSKGTCIYPHIETANPKPYIYTHTYTHTHTHTHTWQGASAAGSPPTNRHGATRCTNSITCARRRRRRRTRNAHYEEVRVLSTMKRFVC